MAQRMQSDAQEAADMKAAVARIVSRAKAQYDDYGAHRRPTPPVIDVLIISGGGDWGAFGAGFLKGWRTIPADQPLAMPEFAAVTGVSTGALIAPFAFLGDQAHIDEIDRLYRNPKEDWAKKRGALYFLPSHISLASIPGLERELKQNVTPDLVKQIADRGDGRLLVVNTTDLDDGSSRAFDLVAEAQRAVATNNFDRIREVMLASAGIPAVFPYRLIDNTMYVDGGITGNIIYGGRIAEVQSIQSVWQQQYPDLPIPKERIWVIFNNQFRPPPEVTPPNWPGVLGRALATSTRAATMTALRHMLAMVEISRLKRHADIEVRIASIPEDWKPPKEGTFVKESMNDLADVGLRLGSDRSCWQMDVPSW